MIWAPLDLPPPKFQQTPIIRTVTEDTLSVDITSVQARFVLTNSPNQLSAQVRIDGQMLQDGDLELHCEGLNFSNIHGTPQPNSFQTLADRVRIRYMPPLQTGQNFVLFFHYSAPPSSSIQTVGFHYLTDIAFTFNEPFGARKWLPIHDVPYDRFQWSISVLAPQGWKTVSNSTQFVTDTSFTTTNSSIVPYLVHFASAQYDTWSEVVNTFQGTPIQLAYFTRNQFTNAARYDWQRTPQIIQVLSEIIDDYPFPLDGYGMVEAPILGGSAAMEHLAMSTIGSNLLTGDRRYELVVVHELAHQWFGNAVTPASFQDIWLNEGFASYFESLWLEQVSDSDPIQHRKKQAENYFHEARYLKFPLANPPPDNLFTATVYHKGAWVLHQLRLRLGDAEFLRRLRIYFHQNKLPTRSIASTNSMIDAFSLNRSDRDTEFFLQEWTQYAGHPEIQGQFVKEGNGTKVTIQQVQSTPIFYSGLPLSLEIRRPTGSEFRSIYLMGRSYTDFWDNVSPENLYFVWNDSALVEFKPVLDERVRTLRPTAKLKLLSNPACNSARLLISVELAGVHNGNLYLFDQLGRQILRQPLNKISSGEKYILVQMPQLPSGYYVWSFQISTLNAVTPMIYLR